MNYRGKEMKSKLSVGDLLFILLISVVAIMIVISEWHVYQAIS